MPGQAGTAHENNRTAARRPLLLTCTVISTSDNKTARRNLNEQQRATQLSYMGLFGLQAYSSR